MSAPHDYETRIEWERDPSGLDYLREFTTRTRKRTGEPTYGRRDYIVYGWSVVSRDAPTDPTGCVTRRLFVLKPTDRGGPEYDGDTWEHNWPAEAVEIESIEAGEPSASRGDR